MRIRNDGVGSPREVLEDGRPGHNGVPGMREHASQIGGKLEIGREPEPVQRLS